jgi:hypothetical protein
MSDQKAYEEAIAKDAQQDEAVQKALDELFADRPKLREWWTSEALHYSKLEQEELNDPPEAPDNYDEVKAFLKKRDLWFPA